MILSRRHFIKQSAALTVSAAVSGAIVAKPSRRKVADKKRRIKTCLKFKMLKSKASIVDRFSLLKEIGFDGVELMSPGELDLAEVREAMKETGLLVPGIVDSVHWNQRLSSDKKAERAAGVEGLKTALRDCAYVGGSMVLLVPGKVIEGEADYKQCWDRSIVEIRKALPLAEELNVKIAIENVWNNFIVKPEEAVRYMNEIDHPLLGWYFDVGNIAKYNDPAAWFSVLPSEKIFRLDIKGFDTDLGKFTKTGEGTIDWSGVMKACDASGFSFRNDAWASAEVKGGNEARVREIYANLSAAIGA